MYQDDKALASHWRRWTVQLHTQCLYPYSKVLTGISSGDWWCASLRSVSVESTVTVFPAGMAERKKRCVDKVRYSVPNEEKKN